MLDERRQTGAGAGFCSKPESERQDVANGITPGFARISDDDVEDWQSSSDIVLRRFAELRDLEGAFGRRALTECTKGILTERHSIDEARLRCCAIGHAPTIAN